MLELRTQEIPAYILPIGPGTIHRNYVTFHVTMSGIIITAILNENSKNTCCCSLISTKL